MARPVDWESGARLGGGEYLLSGAVKALFDLLALYLGFVLQEHLHFEAGRGPPAPSAHWA